MTYADRLAAIVERCGLLIRCVDAMLARVETEARIFTPEEMAALEAAKAELRELYARADALRGAH